MLVASLDRISPMGILLINEVYLADLGENVYQHVQFIKRYLYTNGVFKRIFIGVYEILMPTQTCSGKQTIELVND